MKTINSTSSVTIKAIRNANAKLVAKGVVCRDRGNNAGGVMISVERGTYSHFKTLSKEEISSAYKESLSSYAEKL